MTFASLKALTSALLIGDKKLPTDSTQLLPLVDYGLQKIATKADALKLLTTSKDFSIIRVASNGMYIRKPILPLLDEEVMDIDDELCYALANFIAAMLSQTKTKWFNDAAIEIINDYNTKVYDIIMGTDFDPAKGYIV